MTINNQTIAIIGDDITSLVAAFAAYKNGATCILIEGGMHIKSGDDISNIEREWINLIAQHIKSIISKEPNRLKIINNATLIEIKDDGLVYNANHESYHIKCPTIITTVPLEKRSNVIDISNINTTYDQHEMRHLLELFSNNDTLLTDILNHESSVLLKKIKVGYAAGQSVSFSLVSAERRLKLISNHILPVYTRQQVAKHNTEDDCWVIVNNDVINATLFLNEHPGGRRAILLYAGRDASAEFNMLHQPNVVREYAPESIIGRVA